MISEDKNDILCLTIQSNMKQYRGEIASNLLIIIFAFIGIATFVATIRVYLIHGHIYLWTDIDAEKFSAFGEFIGGVVGTIFTIIATILVWQTYQSQKEELKLTRHLIEKQTEVAYKPDLFLKDTELELQVKLEKDEYTLIGFKTPHENQPKVKLVNIGIEAAKRIELSWDYDLEDIASFLEPVSDKIQIEIENFDKEIEGSFVIEGDESIIYADKPINTDFVLPYRSDDDSKIIELPYEFSFLICHTMIAYYCYKLYKQQTTPVEFPKLYLIIKYEDLLKTTHIKKFEMIWSLSISASAAYVLSEYTNEKQVMKLHISAIEHKN